jgi:hypothetical protein
MAVSVVQGHAFFQFPFRLGYTSTMLNALVNQSQALKISGLACSSIQHLFSFSFSFRAMVTECRTPLATVCH